MSQPRINPFDAVIALAHRMERDGTLNEECRLRVDAAAAAILDGRASVLVTCGWAYGGFSVSMADAMKSYAVHRHGIPASAIVTEVAPRDTVGEAVFTKRHLAVPRRWSRVLVATSDYHLPRALALFSFVYGPRMHVDGIAAGEAQPRVPDCSEVASLRAFRATFEGIASGDDAAIFERLCKSHPFYNGVVHPKWSAHM